MSWFLFSLYSFAKALSFFNSSFSTSSALGIILLNLYNLNSFPLGFIALPKCRPNTLLKGNELKNPQAIDSIKRRKRGESEFVDFILSN